MHIKSYECPPNIDWWVYGTFNPENLTESSYYPHPACKNAEHEFLSFLIAANQVYKIKHKMNSHIKPVTIYSYDGKQHLRTQAVKKSPVIKRGFISKNSSYYFGEETYLVLDSRLAGTIGSYHLGLKAIGDGSIPIQAIRPLSNEPSWVQDKIDSNKTAMTVTPQKIEVLDLATALIQERGFIHAVIYMLGELEIPSNPDAIIENSSAISIIQENIGVAPPLLLEAIINS